jgi:hypothetical protein
MAFVSSTEDWPPPLLPAPPHAPCIMHGPWASWTLDHLSLELEQEWPEELVSSVIGYLDCLLPAVCHRCPTSY